MTTVVTYHVSTCDVCKGGFNVGQATLAGQVQKLEEAGWLHVPSNNACVCRKCLIKLHQLMQMGLAMIPEDARQSILEKMQLQMVE